MIGASKTQNSLTDLCFQFFVILFTSVPHGFLWEVTSQEKLSNVRYPSFSYKRQGILTHRIHAKMIACLFTSNLDLKMHNTLLLIQEVSMPRDEELVVIVLVAGASVAGSLGSAYHQSHSFLTTDRQPEDKLLSSALALRRRGGRFNFEIISWKDLSWVRRQSRSLQIQGTETGWAGATWLNSQADPIIYSSQVHGKSVSYFTECWMNPMPTCLAGDMFI